MSGKPKTNHIAIMTKGFPNMEMKRYNLNIEILELEKI